MSEIQKGFFFFFFLSFFLNLAAAPPDAGLDSEGLASRDMVSKTSAAESVSIS